MNFSIVKRFSQFIFVTHFCLDIQDKWKFDLSSIWVLSQFSGLTKLIVGYIPEIAVSFWSLTFLVSINFGLFSTLEHMCGQLWIIKTSLLFVLDAYIALLTFTYYKWLGSRTLLATKTISKTMCLQEQCWYFLSCSASMYTAYLTVIKYFHIVLTSKPQNRLRSFHKTRLYWPLKSF